MGVMALECILKAPARLACLLFLNQGFLDFGVFLERPSVVHIQTQSPCREKKLLGELC